MIDVLCTMLRVDLASALERCISEPVHARDKKRRDGGGSIDKALAKTAPDLFTCSDFGRKRIGLSIPRRAPTYPDDAISGVDRQRNVLMGYRVSRMTRLGPLPCLPSRLSAYDLIRVPLFAAARRQ